MLINGLIIGFDGANAAIPSRFQRASQMDHHLPRGWGDSNPPGETGGAETHTHSCTNAHTMNNHTHTFGSNGSYDNGSGYEDEGTDGSAFPNDNHSHSGTTGNPINGNINDTFTSGEALNYPPYYEVIWIRSLGFNNIPPGGIIFRESNSRPGLVRHTASDGRFLRGADPGVDAGLTGGALAHNHSVNHQHPNVVHYHSATSSTAGGNNGGGSGGPLQARFAHNHTFNTASRSETPSAYTGEMGDSDVVQPPYRTLVPFINDTENVVPLMKGDIVISLSLSVPQGYTLYTPMKELFLKHYAGDSTINDGTGEGVIGHGHTTGNAHTHSAPGTHNHPDISTGGSISGGGAITGVGPAHVNRYDHTHTFRSFSSTTSSWASGAISMANNPNTLPSFIRVVYLQFQFPIFGGGAMLEA